MNSPSEISSLIKLLDDPDSEIRSHVESRLMEWGPAILPDLENEWEIADTEEKANLIGKLIDRIHFDHIKSQLKSWNEKENPDLLEGVFLISHYRYKNLDIQKIRNLIDKIKLDIWLELQYQLSSLEKVKIINHILYDTYGFAANVSNYHSPRNSFINDVLETRMGNPISLSIVYQLVAQRLNIPIYGVNLPQHFILAYRDDSGLETIHSIHDRVDFESLGKGKILFYVNAFNKGAVLTHGNIEQFLRQLKLPLEPAYFQPCSNQDMVKRMLRNLVFAYVQQKDSKREQEIRFLLMAMGEPDLPDHYPSQQNEDDESRDEN